MVIGITLVLGRGFWQVFIAVGLSMWVEVARLVRGQVISVREKTFIEAAHALGFSHFRILYSHILPVIIGPIIVMASANFASAILIESGLSFLGIGATPVPSWGYGERTFSLLPFGETLFGFHSWICHHDFGTYLHDLRECTSRLSRREAIITNLEVDWHPYSNR